MKLDEECRLCEDGGLKVENSQRRDQLYHSVIMIVSGEGEEETKKKAREI